MNDTTQEPQNDDTQVAAEITDALNPLDMTRVLREAEERGYQRAMAELEQAHKAAQQRAFAMPASDPTPPTTTPTILAGLRPGFWEV